MTIRLFPKFVLSAVMGAVVIGTSAVTMAAESLTVVSWGGEYTHSQVKAYHEPFEKLTGVRIDSVDYSGGLTEIRSQVKSGNVQWDVVDLEMSDTVLGCKEGLLEQIDQSALPPAPDGTPALEDFIPDTVLECAVGTIVWSIVVAFDETKFQKPRPKTLRDFFDVQKFPGKRGLRKNPRSNLEWALMADGVPTGQVYEVLATAEGQARAFAMLERIKPHIVWWEGGGEPLQMLADGQVTMTSAFNGRMYKPIIKEKRPYQVIWDKQIWDVTFWTVVKGTKNLQLAMKFVEFSTDTQRLADQARYISYGPARRSSMDKVSDKIKPHLPTAPDNFAESLRNDFRWWADHQKEMDKRFAALLAK